MVSVISFFILLFVTYSYSAPIEKHETSTTEPGFTTEKMMIEPGKSVNMKLMSDDESIKVPKIHNQRSSEEFNSEEIPTSTIPDSSIPSSTKMSSKRTVEDFLMTTMETSTEFDRRAIRPMESQEDIETSTHILSERQNEKRTNVEPSSSFDSFGKFTGLLPNEEHPTTPEHEKMDHSSEEPTVKNPKLTRTVGIIPGKMTETKMYTNTPMKTSAVIEPDKEKPLSQGQKRGIIEKA